MPKELVPEEKRRVLRPNVQEPAEPRAASADVGPGALTSLQQTVGNQAVQRLLAQRSGDGSFDLDDETAGRINRERGGGQPLDSSIQESMGASLGTDLSGVRVHTSPEAGALSHQIGARAFTTGQDLFFRQGAYQPGSSAGQELIGHELAHVVQQGSGAVGSAVGRMHVNAPGDVFEQQANAAAHSLSGPGAGGVQMQPIPEEEEEQLQLQAVPEEEEELVQQQAAPEEEEELVQPQPVPEEEEELVQQQEMSEEEEVV